MAFFGVFPSENLEFSSEKGQFSTFSPLEILNLNRRNVMQRQSEFAKILEKKLHEGPRSEQKPTNSSSANPFSETKKPFEPWTELIGNLSAASFARGFHNTQYKKFQSPPKARPANKLSQDQLTAFLFFAAHGIKMEPNFTLKDVKKAFRTLAFKMHPDRGGSTQTFLELKAAQDILLQVFVKK
jgi:hypothetical protein